MAENAAKSGAEGWDDEAVAKAHAIYTPSTLSIYDVLVHGLSNHVAWRCPTRKLLELYRANLSVRAVPVSRGRHDVRFTYEPPRVRSGLLITLAALGALLAWTAASTIAVLRGPSPPRAGAAS